MFPKLTLGLLALTALITASTVEITEDFETVESVRVETIISTPHTTTVTKSGPTSSKAHTTETRVGAVESVLSGTAMSSFWSSMEVQGAATSFISPATETKNGTVESVTSETAISNFWSTMEVLQSTATDFRSQVTDTAVRATESIPPQTEVLMAWPSPNIVSAPETSFRTQTKALTTTAAPRTTQSTATENIQVKTVFQIVAVPGLLPSGSPKPRDPKQDAAWARYAESKALSDSIWHKGLNRTEYYKRNFMWLRCTSGNSNNFEAGGSWIDDWGKKWLKENKKSSCSLINWRFVYKNGQGWGDAIVTWDWFWSFFCRQKLGIKNAIKVAHDHHLEYRRQFYLYDCAGFNENTWSLNDVPR